MTQSMWSPHLNPTLLQAHPGARGLVPQPPAAGYTVGHRLCCSDHSSLTSFQVPQSHSKSTASSLSTSPLQSIPSYYEVGVLPGWFDLETFTTCSGDKNLDICK